MLKENIKRKSKIFMEIPQYSVQYLCTLSDLFSKQSNHILRMFDEKLPFGKQEHNQLMKINFLYFVRYTDIIKSF